MLDSEESLFTAGARGRSRLLRMIAAFTTHGMFTAVKIKQNSESRADAPEPHTLHHAPEPHVLHHPAHRCHAERSSPPTVIDDSPLPRVSIIFLMHEI